MIRYTLLALTVMFLAAYAWKDWYKSLCGLVVMMAIIERPDMPSNMFGVTGLNPWNVVMAFILLAWIATRDKSKEVPSLSMTFKVLLLAYLIVVLLSALRMLLDQGGINEYFLATGNVPKSTSTLFVDSIINCLKWVLPALLLYSGCDSRRRWNWAVLSILISSLLLALQVFKQMPLGDILDGEMLQQRANRVLGRNVGYHRIDIAAILAGATWAFYIVRTVIRSRTLRFFALGASGMSFVALLLTGGRAGLFACVIVSFALAALRWRKLFVIAPAIGIWAIVSIPGVQERMLEGFSEETYERAAQDIDTIDSAGRDLYAITSGRVVVWPFVIEKIKEAPLIGFGRRAMLREGVAMDIIGVYGIGLGMGHPHNAYLELLLDAGVLGAAPILLFYFFVLLLGARLFMSKANSLHMVTGGLAIAFVLAQLAASVGAQSFYPREGVVLMWCTIALLLRLHFESKQSRQMAQSKGSGSRKNLKL